MAATCRMSTDWTYRGFRALVLENQRVRATILPEFGAKVHEFVAKNADRDWMFHHPRTQLRAPVYGANIDNWWTGGMDEAIPTAYPCTYRGDELPYMGEAWSQPWSWRVMEDSARRVEVHLSVQTIMSPLRVERWHWLADDEPILHARHRVTNTGLKPYEITWGIHPALAITPSCRIDVPATRLTVAESVPDWHLGDKGSSYEWPYVQGKDGVMYDMRQAQMPAAGWQELHTATPLLEGWAALTDQARKQGVALTFTTNPFNTLWVFTIYGGYRDLYACALEAWTAPSMSLAEAIAEGKAISLAPGASLEGETSLVAYEGLAAVQTVRAGGEVMGPSQV